MNALHCCIFGTPPIVALHKKQVVYVRYAYTFIISCKYIYIHLVFVGGLNPYITGSYVFVCICIYIYIFL